MRLLLALMWLMHFLPLSVLGRFGNAVGSLLFHALKSRRHITLTNLRLCLPHLNEAERRQLAKQRFYRGLTLTKPLGYSFRQNGRNRHNQVKTGATADQRAHANADADFFT